MLTSMTGFATAKGEEGRFSWTWEIRSVNGKGLDLRLRLPDWIEGLEAGLRARLSGALARGNVSVSLKIQARDATAGAVLNATTLETVLSAISGIEERAMALGLSLAPPTAADVLAVRGVFDMAADKDDTAALCRTLLADFEGVLKGFLEMRQG